MVVSLLAAACANRVPPPPSFDCGFGVSHGAPTLAQAHGLSMCLPIPRKDFLEALDRAGVRYVQMGVPKGAYPFIAQPRYRSLAELGEVSTGYVLDGGFDAKRGVNRLYAAYVNDHDRVIYVETQYGAATLF